MTGETDTNEILIERVDLTFDVEGDDRAVFERYFAELMQRYEAERALREARARRSAESRRIGGNTGGWGGSA